MLYGGPSWTISHAGVGSPQVGTTWDFAEGANSWFFETYLLLANPTLSSASAVTLWFRRTDGTWVSSATTVPAGGRVSLATKSVAGLANTSFTTLVQVTNGVGVVAERATYWPINTGGGVYTATGPPAGVAAMTGVSTEADLSSPAAVATGARVSPYAARAAHGTPPRLYQRLAGYPAGGTSVSEDPVVKPPGTLTLVGDAVTERALSGALLGTTDAAATTLAITTTWYGAHLTGGRRR
jgi:hypothetical protein